MPDNNQNLSDTEQAAIENETNAVEQRMEETNALPADLIAQIKKQVTAEIVQEMKEQKVYEEKEREIRREQEDLERQQYIEMMKQSDDPWVDFVGSVRDTDHGQRIELEWNDAFIDYLKQNGINGTDEEQIVQKYISLLLRDMTDKYEERYGHDLV